jgi:hypothetical protein
MRVGDALAPTIVGYEPTSEVMPDYVGFGFPRFALRVAGRDSDRTPFIDLPV